MPAPVFEINGTPNTPASWQTLVQLGARPHRLYVVECRHNRPGKDSVVTLVGHSESARVVYLDAECWDIAALANRFRNLREVKKVEITL